MFSAVIIYCKSILQFISCLVQAMEWKGTIMTWKAIRIIRGTRGKKSLVQLAFCYLINFFFTFWSAELNRKSPVGSCKWVKLSGLNFEFRLIFIKLRAVFASVRLIQSRFQEEMIFTLALQYVYAFKFWHPCYYSKLLLITSFL